MAHENATPRPWKIIFAEMPYGEPVKGVFLVDSVAGTIATLDSVDGKGDLDEHNAALIVDAVNSYDTLKARAELCGELVEALTRFMGCAVTVAEEVNPKGYRWSEIYLDQALGEAHSLLTRAKELQCK